MLTRLARTLARFAEVLPPGDLIDLGCAERPYAAVFTARGFRYIGADLPGNPYADLSLGADGFPEGAGVYDYVLSTQTLEHVADVQRYLRVVRRLLVPDGRVILSTHGIYRYHPDPDDFWRWTGQGLRHELTAAGFVVEQVQGILNSAATALQLWQDVTLGHLPPVLRVPYCWLYQRAIALVDRLSRAASEENACVYVVVARRGDDGAEHGPANRGAGRADADATPQRTHR